MVEVTTCKFVRDASLNNDSFIHCDLLTLANINNGANLHFPLHTQKQKSIQLQGGFAPDLTPQRCSPPLDHRHNRLAIMKKKTQNTQNAQKLSLNLSHEATSHL